MSVVAASVSAMSQLTSPLTHPLVACVNGLEELLDNAADLDPGYLRTADKADVLVRLTKLIDRVEALRLRVIATAMDVADTEGAPTVAAWLAPRTQSTTRSQHGREQLARWLDRRWRLVGDGLAAGTVSMAQAEVIVRALEALDAPAVGERIDRELLRRAEAHLVARAATFTPPALRTLGEHILEVICPEQYDDQERKALVAAERRASAATRLTLHARGDGSVDVRARIPEATAARLQTYLEAFTAPRRESIAAGRAATVGSDPTWATPGTGPGPSGLEPWTRWTGGGCRPTNAAGRRSVRSSKRSTPTGYPCTGAPRPRWW